MKKIISLVILVLLVFMSCDMNNLVSNATEYDTYEDVPANAAGYVYILDGNKVLLTNAYESTSARFLDVGDSIITVSEIPGVGTVVETENGKYYLEMGSTFKLITLPENATLHLHQFGRYTVDGTNYIYYGVGNKLYRKLASGFDNDFTDGEVVVDGQIFSDTAELVTKLQYLVSDTGNVRYNTRGIVPPAKNGIWMSSIQLEWLSNNSKVITDDFYTKTSDNILYNYDGSENSKESSYDMLTDLHVAYFTIDANGLIHSLKTGGEIDFEDTSNAVLSVDDNFGVKYFGQEHKMNDVIVNNRIDSSNAYAWTGTYGFGRDTMFRSYWDNQVYFEYDADRTYIVLNSDGSSVSVEVYVTVNFDVQKIGTGFSIDFETIGSYDKLIPNMWVDIDNTVWVARENVISHYDANGNPVEADIIFTNRIDAFTILPRTNVNDPATLIVMDEDANWYNTDGSPYTGANVVAEY